MDGLLNLPVILPTDECLSCPQIKKLTEKQKLVALKLLTMVDLIDTIMTGQQRIEFVLDVMTRDLQDLKAKIEAFHKVD